MANEDNEIDRKRLNSSIKLNAAFDDMTRRFNTVALANSIQNQNEIDGISSELDKALGQNFTNYSKYTGDSSMTTMLNKILANSDNQNPIFQNKSVYDLFQDDVGEYGVFFYDRYKNINNQYEDLRIITEYLYEMDEVVNTVRDNIVCADDMGLSVSRQIHFLNSSDKQYISIVESLERKYDLKNIIKNSIAKETLRYGNYYVYTIPYKNLFAMHETKVKNQGIIGRFKNGVKESANYVPETSSIRLSLDDSDIGGLNKIKESYDYMLETASDEVPRGDRLTKSQIKDSINSLLENIEVCNESAMPLMEGDLKYFDDPKFAELVKKAQARRKKDLTYSRDTKTIKPFEAPKKGELDYSTDSVIDPKSMKAYSDISDTYMKLYLPGKIIPIKVLDFTIGYYVMYETFGEVQNNLLINGSMNRLNIAYQQERRKQLDDDIIDVIAQKIVNALDSKFVKDNAKFKELLANAIAYDDFYRKSFRIQYVPPEYMTEFRVNENPETKMGESILRKSLFYAKLYLTILIFKIITILTKSNDTRVYYVKNSGLDKNMTKRVQDAARNIKRNEINFNDLSCVNTVLAKVGKARDVYMGVGKSGERGLEFEILQGQDVQLNTDLMEFLRKNMINNTGVPAVILSYMEEADFARTLTMQHSKYLSRIISYQEELEGGVTELYKKLLHFDTSLDDTIIDGFRFSFTRPKALNAQNMADLISNAENNAAFICRTLVGDSADDKIKEKVTNYLISKVLLPGIYDWDKLKKMVQDGVLELQIDKYTGEVRSSKDDNNNDSGGGYY